MGNGMTMAEKILARASSNDRVKPGEYVTARIDTLMMPEQCFHEAYQLLAPSGCSEVWDPGRIIIVIDHRLRKSEGGQEINFGLFQITH